MLTYGITTALGRSGAISWAPLSRRRHKRIQAMDSQECTLLAVGLGYATRAAARRTEKPWQNGSKLRRLVNWHQDKRSRSISMVSPCSSLMWVDSITPLRMCARMTERLWRAAGLMGPLLPA